MPDPVLLGRIQFAANISFHILFPTITIALAWALLYFKIKYNKTQEVAWDKAYQFWVKIFALTFALGVVSGVTMSFQFGTNWPGFMHTVGNIAGPLLAYEVLSAFFLEATFLGIMLFGRQRVSNRIHTLATFLVAFGTTLSAFWIIVLNSWMHTPQGFTMIENQAHAVDWLQIIFNPSMPYRLAHMLVGSFLTVMFLIAGISAYRYLKGNRGLEVQLPLRQAITAAAILLPIQIFIGDLHGLNTLQHQPAKLAAMEGIWRTEKGVDAVLFGIPDETAASNHYEIKIPKLASLYLTHTWDGEVQGLVDFKGMHPPVRPMFFAFRLMVGIGLLMGLVAWCSCWQMRHGRMLKPYLARVLVMMSFAGWVAVLAGWYVTEIGRQPYLVYGLLKTADAAAAIAQPVLASSLIMYVSVYISLIVAYISTIFYLARKADS